MKQNVNPVIRLRKEQRSQVRSSAVLFSSTLFVSHSHHHHST